MQSIIKRWEVRALGQSAGLTSYKKGKRESRRKRGRISSAPLNTAEMWFLFSFFIFPVKRVVSPLAQSLIQSFKKINRHIKSYMFAKQLAL